MSAGRPKAGRGGGGGAGRDAPRWPPFAAWGRDRRELAWGAVVVVGTLGLLALLSMRQGTLSGNYLAGAMLTMALFALFALGLALQFGEAGLVNFGHVASAAIGAYGVGIAALQGWPLWSGVLLGVVAAVALAALLGVPALRLREDSLAIVTIGFAEILRTIATSEGWLTRGPLGIYQFPRPGLEWATDPAGPWAGLAGALGVQPYRLFVLALAAGLALATYLVFARLVRSPWGRVLRAIREDEDVAAALGKPTFQVKLQVLAVGAVPAALFGMLFAWAYAQIVPDNYPPLVTFYAWIILVVGGIANLRGAVVGAVVVWALFLGSQLLDLSGVPLAGGLLAALTRAGPGQLLLVGVLLVAVMMFRPQGILGRKEEMLFAR